MLCFSGFVEVGEAEYLLAGGFTGRVVVRRCSFSLAARSSAQNISKHSSFVPSY